MNHERTTTNHRERTLLGQNKVLTLTLTLIYYHPVGMYMMYESQYDVGTARCCCWLCEVLGNFFDGLEAISDSGSIDDSHITQAKQNILRDGEYIKLAILLLRRKRAPIPYQCFSRLLVDWWYNLRFAFQDVSDGVSALLLGCLPSSNQPLALVGGNCSIQGFDATGAER